MLQIIVEILSFYFIHLYIIILFTAFYDMNNNNRKPLSNSSNQNVSNGNSFTPSPYNNNTVHFPILPQNASQMSQAMILNLFQIVQQQTYSLQNLMRKIQMIAEKTEDLNHRLTSLKATQKSNNNVHNNSGIQPILNKSMKNQNYSDNLDSVALLQILFGNGNSYQYKLELVENIGLPLYRERNFSIHLRLINNNGQSVQNDNKIPLSLAVYTSQNPPKFIQMNTAGQKMIKGYTEQALLNGFCNFEKIQLREVTSHYRNGWIFIVIIPSMTPLGGATNTNKMIDFKKIEPLVVDKIVVKAKKLKQTKDCLNKESSIVKIQKKQNESSQIPMNERQSEKAYEQQSER